MTKGRTIEIAEARLVGILRRTLSDSPRLAEVTRYYCAAKIFEGRPRPLLRDPRSVDPATTWYDGGVYAIASEAGPVKIGYTERSVGDRIGALKVGHPWPLEAVACCDGTPDDEMSAHRVLHPWRMQGEWFQPAPDVMALVALMRRCVSMRDALCRYSSAVAEATEAG